MNKPLRLPLALAVAFALGSPQVHALGLGQIEVRSALNQPLVAEIPVIEASPGEANNLSVKLASPDAFARVGLDRPTLQAVNLSFEVDTDARGRKVIRVTTPSNVTDPFMSFLLEADWGKGKILREYTVLLDPPSMTPIAASPARVTAAPEPVAAAPVQTLDPGTDAPPQYDSVPSDTPAVSPTASSSPTYSSFNAGDNYSVVGGDTLWEIAQQARPDSSISINQMMMALLRANPDAFVGNNINRLKKGAVLRIPGRDEAAMMTAAQAAAEVRDQIQAWSGRASTVSQPADSSITSSAATQSASSSGDSRLELTPPRAESAGGGGSQSGASGSGGGSELRAELNRSQEEVSALTQENVELKSRVTELEQIQSDSRRLLELKDSELAAVQRRLAELESAAGITPSTPPAPETSSVESTAAATPESPEASIEAESKSQDEPQSPSDMITPESVSEPVAEADQSMTQAYEEPASALDPVATPEPEPVSEPVSEPIALNEPAAAPPPAPAPASEGFFGISPMVLGGAGLGLAGLIAAMALMRRRKAQRDAEILAGGGAVAAATPLSAAFAASSDNPQEEAELIEAIGQYPNDLHLHLDLLKYYFGRNDAVSFERAAEAMYAQVQDAQDAAWQEALNMGRQISPTHPLFSGRAPAPGAALATAAGGFATASTVAAANTASPVVDTVDEMDWFAAPASKTPVAPTAPAAPAAPVSDPVDSAPSFDFDTPDLGTSAAAASQTVAADFDPVDTSLDSDAAATKLELARAYLDMGDSDGARGMLEEVLGEGSPNQRKEAQQLLDGIF